MSEKSIKISSEWYDLISKRLEKSSEFQSVDDYVNYILSEMFSNENDDEIYSEEEKAEIEKNLKDLGYI